MSNSELVTIETGQALQGLSTEQLKRSFFESLDITVRHFQHMAEIWCELERRGENMQDLRHGIAVYIEMIAHQRLDANLAVKYLGQKVLLNAVSRLPIDQQQRLIEAETVDVATIENGELATKTMKLSKLQVRDIYTVFSDSGIRPIGEQQKILIKRAARTPAKTGPRRARRITVDPERQVLEVGGSAANLDRVLQVLGEYYGVDFNQLIQQKNAGNHEE